jgi:hypothetical protein
LGVYEISDEIDLNTLPERFALKCTHGCGFNIICYNKNELDWKKEKKKLDRWMKIDFSKVFGEIHYRSMKHRIICENFIDDDKNTLPIDYKVYCFHGKAFCTMVCSERGTKNGTSFTFYDRKWLKMLPFSKKNLHSLKHVFIKPIAYEEMISAAEVLSKPFPFVRMDFYNIGEKVVLGEMTFTPGGCIDSDFTDLAQYELGRLIKLPEKY